MTQSKTRAELRDIKFREPEFQAQVSCSSHYFAFVEGAKWADANPPQYFQDLVKALDYLSRHHELTRGGSFSVPENIRMSNFALSALDAYHAATQAKEIK